ncbi:hypothetical protein [Chryseobacterium koreense]|uniref:hypothetical protein n=1 Tax=Chryseobacterium koreense TaxID=232216 RepID=UPI0026F14667|nr:hypothetical protein [Chryseobacterium koreense]
MKKRLILDAFLLLLLFSCISTKVSPKNNYDFSKLKTGAKYIIKTKDMHIYREFEFEENTRDLITGLYKNQKIQIEKENILKINKFSYGKSIPVVVLSAVVVVTFIALQNYTLGDYYK